MRLFFLKRPLNYCISCYRNHLPAKDADSYNFFTSVLHYENSTWMRDAETSVQEKQVAFLYNKCSPVLYDCRKCAVQVVGTRLFNSDEGFSIPRHTSSQKPLQQKKYSTRFARRKSLHSEWPKTMTSPDEAKACKNQKKKKEKKNRRKTRLKPRYT